MDKNTRLLYTIVLLQAVVAIVGSLIFSNGLGYAPCDLCWYQRICMYPLAIIAAVALIRKDKHAVWYGLPLSIIGLLFSVYQLTLYTIANYTTVSITTPCSVNGTSCTSKYIEIFGFLSIPALSFLAFVVTTTCLVLLTRKAKER